MFRSGPKDSKTGLALKPTRDRFHRKPEKSIGFWYKIHVPNFTNGSQLTGRFSASFQFKIQIPKFDK
jgi:hypothetical protein